MISKLERLLSGGTVTWDRLLVTDGLSPEAVEQITAVSPAAPDRVWVVIDHDTPAGSVAVAEKQKALLDWARQTGAVFRSGRGIGYALLLESGLREGEIVLSGGAHAAAVGAAGAVGLSLPPAELAGALESGQISLSPAPPLRLAVTGPLSPYLSVRDLAWTLIRSGQCSGKAVVIRAPQLTAAQAMDLCGLLGAAGAVTALCVREDFPADETVDLTALQPMAAPPGDAARVVPAGETDGLRVNQVFIGGCGGGSLEALRETADLWRGRTVCPY
uniref:aconitase family protein n=2 Tax=Oscillospiraceae TaxID=216572 RepID=UPI003FEE94CA